MKIEQIDVTKLKPFANHPFKIRQDRELAQMADSIRDIGVITPILARPIEGGYEVIQGIGGWRYAKSLALKPCQRLCVK